MACWGKPTTDHEHLEPPNDIRKLFGNEKYSENGVMSVNQFRRFLSEYQEEHTQADVEHIINSVDPQQKGLQFDDFFNYIFGDLNLVLPPKKLEDVKLNAPLAEYFIHTTRVKISLLSRSGKSKREIASVREALRSGSVRVIHLDFIYDKNKSSSYADSEDLQIRSTLKDCMEAIIDSKPFTTSPYPVIITIEGNLDSTLESKVTGMAKLKFGEDALQYYRGDLSQLSLEDSKEKIFLLQISPKEYEIGKGVHHQNKVIRDSPGDANTTSANDVKRNGNISEELSSNNGNIRRLTQPKLESIIKKTDHASQIVEFTKRYLLMVNPVEKRSGSSNCNPLMGWSHGAQMIPVNMQGHDKYPGLMQGMFRTNGGCGYVKKPPLLIQSTFDPKTTRPVKSTFKVKIFMGDGWHLDFPATKFDVFSPPDFFLKVRILGVGEDNAKDETDTEDNNWRPKWNKEFEFILNTPELAFLRIEARDVDEGGSPDFAGQTCLPVWEVKRGIRTVPLYDKRGRMMYPHVRLLVQFKLDPCN